ncbi:MAG: SEC-C metal-binding domain-containing protein [Gemmataceae bacterium]
MSDTKVEASLWERFTDGISSIGEGIMNFLGRLFGSSNERLIRSLGYYRPKGAESHTATPGSLLFQTNSYEEQMQALSDEELKAKTAEFRERLANNETLDEILPEAFAACREAGRRTKNMRHFDVQIIGGIVLHRGMIAEMVTGEGKTLVATLPAYLNAIEGKGVHIVTVNDYLARRDCEWMSPIYHALGISAGFIQSDMDADARRKAYDCDITYGTNSEFGFDYLRDNMKPARWGDNNYPVNMHQVQKALNFAVIDEVDNILIDEARTPLIISGPAFGDLRRYSKANEIALKLTELEKKAQQKLKEAGHGLNIPDHPLLREESEAEAEEAAKKRKKKHEEELVDEEMDVAKVLPTEAEEKKKGKKLGYYFEVNEKDRSCHLTDEGVRKAEELAGVESFYTAGNMEWPHLIDNSLKAQHLYHKDKQYVVMRHPETGEQSVIIVDEFTGRLMIGRQWSDGLHQAVEAKHAAQGVKIKEETQTLATITLQNFFKLYKKLAGMTGTAMTESSEFWKIYKLDVIAIPTNKPLIRINSPDFIYLTEKEKWEAIVGDVEKTNRYDVIHMNDGTEHVGTIKKETEEEIDIQLKEGNERKTLKIEEIDYVDYKGRPILIGTTDVEKSEKLAAMLKRRGIKHELLNAKPEYAAREAEIVAQAGRIGAVTISTNMAGRGTDIVLGGNPETLAWARLKDKYPTRLDVPPDIWKTMVEDIRAKEGMEEEGQKVVEMGGLHIIGTERHEARRIDNQLRGRAGRQGDPGSSRFYLSLQDDLMRIFAGEWVASVLQRLGMQEGQAIESRMVSRRIEAAQKKVEERNFDIRKNLLEYDEVMDHQRKRTYGFRQEILEGANCKLRILNMIEEQVDNALNRFLAADYGPASFAEMAGQRLGVEFNPGDFTHSSFQEAERTARDRAITMAPTVIHEAMDENLDADVDQKEWNWGAMSTKVNTMWGLKTTDRSLKQVGRDNLAEYLIAEATRAIGEIDLSKGAVYLQPDWGKRSLLDWLDRKFAVKIDLDPNDTETTAEEIKQRIMTEIHKLYRKREEEYPVLVAMERFMSEQRASGPMGQRYDREGLLGWYKTRFGDKGNIPDDAFRTESRAKLRELMIATSRENYPQTDHYALDEQIAAFFQGPRAGTLSADHGKQLSDWVKESLQLDVEGELLDGATQEEARDLLWCAFDNRFRPEMRGMERSLLLNQLDAIWKNHLYTMDHLRSGIGLVGYAQIDPKTEYKRQGMKEFDTMWENLADKVTDIVFRMETDPETFQESVWLITRTVHEAAQPTLAGMRAEQTQAIEGSQQSEKKQEPIRNRMEKVGRNDPCPCGSGKKYKNCCMRMGVR